MAWSSRSGADGAQRIYSRDDLERLRFVVDTVEAGTTPADAHRLLAERLGEAGSLSRPDPHGATIVVLLAERDRYAAELLEYFLRTEGYDVCVALRPGARRADVRRASTRVVDRRSDDRQAAVLSCAPVWRSDGAAPVLAMSALDLADEAILGGGERIPGQAGGAAAVRLHGA